MLIVFCADYLAYILGISFFAYLYYTKYAWREKIELFLAAVVTVVLSRGVLTEIIRLLYQRPRPFTALQFTPLFPDSAWSFPSGHSTFFYGLSTVVYLYDKRWGTVFFIASVIITFARVAAGVHYPSDIIGGAIIGVCSGLFGYYAVRRYLAPKANQTY
jgi:undecaprenyl-diphosphatase